MHAFRIILRQSGDRQKNLEKTKALTRSAIFQYHFNNVGVVTYVRMQRTAK